MIPSSAPGPAAASQDGRICFICLESDDGRADRAILPCGCGCSRAQSSAGLAHLAYMVQSAQHNARHWTRCPTCTLHWSGELQLGLARARWDLVRGRPVEDVERLDATYNLATALRDSDGLFAFGG
jgi:hypothetical protein